MKKRADETYNKSVKKNNHFNNFFINQKCSNRNNLLIKDINNTNIKLDNMRNLNLCLLSFSLTPQRTSNNNLNEKENLKQYILIDKYKMRPNTNIKREKNNIIKKKLSFYNNYNSNNDANYKKKGKDYNNDNKINFLLQHKKINFLKLRKNMNEKKKKKNQSYIVIENTKKKYKTILSKQNTKYNRNTFLPQESSHHFEKFSPKYNNNNMEKENIHEPYKLYQNKIVVSKSPCYDKNKPKYCRTDNSTHFETNTCLENKNYYMNFPRKENLKMLYSPKYITSNQNVLNLKYIFDKIKNNKLKNKYISRLLNIKNEFSLDNTILKEKKNEKKKEGVKYSAINLNMLAQIPNRIMPIDNHGKEFDGFNSFRTIKNKLIKNNKNASNQVKLSFGDLKLLRKKIFNIYHSNEVTRHNSKKNSDRETLKTTVPKNKMYKTFYKCSISDLNEKDMSKRNINIRRNYLSGKLVRKKRKYFDPRKT